MDDDSYPAFLRLQVLQLHDLQRGIVLSPEPNSSNGGKLIVNSEVLRAVCLYKKNLQLHRPYSASIENLANLSIFEFAYRSFQFSNILLLPFMFLRFN